MTKNSSIKECLHDPTITCGFSCWYYWNTKKSPALRRQEEEQAAAGELNTRVLEWQKDQINSTSSTNFLASTRHSNPADDENPVASLTDERSRKRRRKAEKERRNNHVALESPEERIGRSPDTRTSDRDPRNSEDKAPDKTPARYMSYKRFLDNFEKKSIQLEPNFPKQDPPNGPPSTSAVPEFKQTHTDEDAMLADTQADTQEANIDRSQSLQNKETHPNTQQDGGNVGADAKEDEPSPPTIASAIPQQSLPSAIQSATSQQSSPSAIPSVTPQQSSVPVPLSCVERKRLVLFTRPSKLMIAIQAWVTDTLDKLDPFRDDDTCWFHPDAQPTTKTKSGSVRPRGKIGKRFTWKDIRGQHYVTLNFGIAAKIVDRKLSKEQKDGWVSRGWHLSHLCGNWTCINPRHATVEPGAVNLARNNCFSHRSGCEHEPPCMKDKKVALGLDGRILDASVRKSGVTDEYDFDYTTQDFGDDEEMTMLGGDDLVVVDAEEPLFDDNSSVDESFRDQQVNPDLTPRSNKIGGLGILEAARRSPGRITAGQDGDDVAHSAGVTEEEGAQGSSSTDQPALSGIQETQDAEPLPNPLLPTETEEEDSGASSLVDPSTMDSIEETQDIEQLPAALLATEMSTEIKEKGFQSLSLIEPSTMYSIEETQDMEQLPDALLASEMSTEIEEQGSRPLSLIDPSALDSIQETQHAEPVSNAPPHSPEVSVEPSSPSASEHSLLPPVEHELLSTPQIWQISGAQKEEDDMPPSLHHQSVPLDTSTPSDIAPEAAEFLDSEQILDDEVEDEMSADLDPKELTAIAEFQQHLPSPPVDSQVSGEDMDEDDGWSF